MSFNEWMAYIYRMNGHSENKIQQYEQICRGEIRVSQNRQSAEGLRNPSASTASKDNQNPKEN